MHEKTKEFIKNTPMGLTKAQTERIDRAIKKQAASRSGNSLGANIANNFDDNAPLGVDAKNTPTHGTHKKREPYPVNVKLASKRVLGRIESTPVQYRKRYVAALRGETSPRRAISAMCHECIGYENVKTCIGECTAFACPLWAYRPYQIDKNGEIMRVNTSGKVNAMLDELGDTTKDNV